MFFTYTIFWIGAFGGISGEALHWWGLRESQELPHYLRSVFYWSITLIMVLIGAGIALLQLGPGGDPLLAFELGILAPMLLKKIVAQSAPPEGAQGIVSSARVMRFIKG